MTTQEGSWLIISTTTAFRNKEQEHPNPIPNEELHPERFLLLKIPQTSQRKPPRRDTCSTASSYLGAFLDSINKILTQVTIGSGSSMKKMYLVMSMILIVCNSPYNVQMSKVSFDTQDNLLTVSSCKIIKQTKYFPNTMVQNTHSNSKGEELKHSEGRLDQGKTDPAGQRSNPEALWQTLGFSVSKGLDGCITTTSHTSHSLVTFTPYMQLSMEDVS